MTRPDHYATLGVPKDASLADIKRAYRKLAREAHPDNGGSNERMQALNAAKEVLYDEARRADYDAGGDGDDKEDPIEAEARQLIIDLFSEAIAGNVMNPFQSSLGGLQTGIQECVEKIAVRHGAIKRMERQLNRVIARNGGHNAYNDIIHSGIKAAEISINSLERQMLVANKAISILKADYQPAPQFHETRDTTVEAPQFLNIDWLGNF